MALERRYVLRVDATGSDTLGSGSSASIKDSSTISAGVTLDITNSANGSTAVKSDASAFAGPPVVGDTVIDHTNTVLYHIQTVSGDNKTLTFCETPAGAVPGPAAWGVGGYFLTLARAASVCKPVNPNGSGAGGDEHLYSNVAVATTAKATFSNPGVRSRPLVVEGYTTTLGDGGRATYDITGTAITTLEANAAAITFRNWKATNSGAVTLWQGFNEAGSAVRTCYENCWATPTTAPARTSGFSIKSAGTYMRCRADNMTNDAASLVDGWGFETDSAFGEAILFCLAHDLDSDFGGDGGSGCIAFGISDTNNKDNLANTGSVYFTPPQAQNGNRCLFTTVYNGTGPGIVMLNSANHRCNVIIGNILANNSTYGIEVKGLTNLSSGSLHVVMFNDYFGNGTDTMLNVEESPNIGSGTTTESTADPTFTDAAGGDFTIGTNLKGAAAITIGGPSS